jgi:hypothetical protein
LPLLLALEAPMNCSRIVLLVGCLTLIPLSGFAQGLKAHYWLEGDVMLTY